MGSHTGCSAYTAYGSDQLSFRNVPDVEAAAEASRGFANSSGSIFAALVLHQGALAPGRGCEALVDAVSRLPDTHLLFLGDPGRTTAV